MDQLRAQMAQTTVREPGPGRSFSFTDRDMPQPFKHSPHPSSPPHPIMNQQRPAMPVRESNLEQWVLTKLEMDGHKPVWRIACRQREVINPIDIQKAIREPKAKKNVFAEKRGNKHGQVNQLEVDRNLMEPDAYAVWRIKDVSAEREAGTDSPTRSLRVVLERVASHTPRFPPNTYRQLRWCAVIDLEKLESRCSPASQVAPHAMNPQPQAHHANAAINMFAGDHPQARRDLQGTPAHPSVDPRVAPHHGRPDAPGDSRWRAAAFEENLRAWRQASQRTALETLQGEADEEGDTSSVSTNDTVSVISSDSTSDTEWSYITQHSKRKGTTRKNRHHSRSSSPADSRQPRRTPNRKSSHVRQHRRPRDRNLSRSGSESPRSPDYASDHYSPSHSRRRHKHRRGQSPPYIRQHERPQQSELSRVQSSPKYRHDHVEICPNKGSGTRREGLHSRSGSDDLHRPSIIRRHTTMSGHRHSFGLPPSRPVYALEQGERPREHGEAPYDHVEPSHLESKASELRKWERSLRERELKHVVTAEVDWQLRQREQDRGRSQWMNYLH